MLRRDQFVMQSACPYCGNPSAPGKVTCGGVGGGIDCLELFTEEIKVCEDCMSQACAICGHPPCPMCLDDCDHPDCLEPGKPPLEEALFKTHTCVFTHCDKHKRLATPVIDLEGK